MSPTSMTREQWVEVFEASGLDEKAMRTWHSEFERRYPAGHEAFLQWISVPAGEIRRIRAASRNA